MTGHKVFIDCLLAEVFRCFPDGATCSQREVKDNSASLDVTCGEHVEYRSRWLLDNYEGKMKSARRSLRKTRDKLPLGRDPDRSCCHLHTNVKLSWSQPMDTWVVTKKTLL